jgi:hypothetical protein
MSTNASEEHIASIFYPENGGNIFLRNVSNSIPGCTSCDLGVEAHEGNHRSVTIERKAAQFSLDRLFLFVFTIYLMMLSVA